MKKIAFIIVCLCTCVGAYADNYVQKGLVQLLTSHELDMDIFNIVDTDTTVHQVRRENGVYVGCMDIRYFDDTYDDNTYFVKHVRTFKDRTVDVDIAKFHYKSHYWDNTVQWLFLEYRVLDDETVNKGNLIKRIWLVGKIVPRHIIIERYKDGITEIIMFKE